MRLSAKDVLQATEGDLIGTATATADSYAIDTRRLAAGGCFVALQGDRDGNDFVADAWARGATIAIGTSRKCPAMTEIRLGLASS